MNNWNKKVYEETGKRGFLVKLLGKSGAGFKRQFGMESYR